MRQQLVAAIRAMLIFTVVLGLGYPLAVTAVAQVAFPDQADGSLIRDGELVVGSKLIGQAFDDPQWFHPRPSAAGDGYDASASSASHLGPTSNVLLSDVERRTQQYRAENQLKPSVDVPIDAVTASGSGLDPHISIANARLQADRVAEARDLPLKAVLNLVDQHTEGRAFGFLGEPGVNVLELNIALNQGTQRDT